MGRAVQDPYELLNLDRRATTAEVKGAFRRLAAQHHPDRNPNDPQAQVRFQQLNEAYQILSDPQKRAAYDRYGPAAFRPGGRHGESGLGGFDGLLSDLLGAIGIRAGQRGNISKRVRLSFEEAARGCRKELRYERVDTCPRCDGGGGEPQSQVETCPTCGGRGQIHFQHRGFTLPFDHVCSRCRGSGQIPRTRCTDCGGRGLTSRVRTVEVELPAGIDTGSSRVVPGAGNRLRPDRPRGDLEVRVEVAEHPFFRRSGDNVVCGLPISFSQAALGGQVEVPTLDGTIRLRVPPATQPGSVLRVRGKGIPHRRRSGRGDQLVEVNVEVPTALSERARELVQELGRELGDDLQPQQRSFMEKLRGLFG
jgi:molecular chaperone DnaJ